MAASKLLTFEYVLYELLQWYEETGRPKEHNDFSILKSLKLLFFVSAGNTNINQPSMLLDEVFCNYVAMPYGHVESDIYSELRATPQQLEFYNVDNQRTIEINPANTHNLIKQIDRQVQREIKESINFIKSQNPDLVLLTAFDLVDLSHAWYSWQFFFNKAKRSSSRSQPILVDTIKSEDKIYSL